MPDYGLDFAGVEDITPTFATISGAAGVAHAVARRLTTPAGALIDDPDYGFDLRLELNSSVNTAFLEQRITDECFKEERVTNVVVATAYDQSTFTMTVNIEVTLSDDTSFRLTLNVSQLSVEVLTEAA